jgi:hypothetical protein
LSVFGHRTGPPHLRPAAPGDISARPIIWHGSCSVNVSRHARRHIMARFESIAFGFCATFTAVLTIATLSPIA